MNGDGWENVPGRLDRDAQRFTRTMLSELDARSKKTAMIELDGDRHVFIIVVVDDAIDDVGPRLQQILEERHECITGAA